MDFDSAVNNFNQALLGSAQMIAASNTSHEDRKLIREQNEISRQWNEKVWHMQNEYNLPKNQLARLVDSGLNPALMYGDVTSGLAQNVNGSYGAAQANPSQLPNAIANVQNSMIARENFNVQMDNVRASTDLMRSQASKNNADADLARANVIKGQRDSYSQFYQNQLNFRKFVDIEKPQFEKYSQQVDASIEQIRHMIPNIDADTNNKNERTRQIGVDIENSILTTMQNLQNMKKQLEVMNSEIFSNMETAKTQKVQRSYLRSLGAFYDANTDKIKKLTNPEVKKAWAEYTKAYHEGVVAVQHGFDSKVNSRVLSKTQDALISSLQSAASIARKQNSTYELKLCTDILESLSNTYKNYVGTNMQVLNSLGTTIKP